MDQEFASEWSGQGRSGVTRRKFLGTALLGGATLFAGGSKMIFAGNPPAASEKDMVFRVGGDLPVNRLGFGAMRITGEGIWGWPKDREEGKRGPKSAGGTRADRRARAAA